MPPENERRFRTFILGAGFSRAAGLPLAPELWQQVLLRVDRAIGRDNPIRRDLARFIRFKRATSDADCAERSVDFEEFLGFLDVEHFLSLRGSDTWSSAGNISQLLIRWFIGQTLFERQREGKSRRTSAYLKFAEGLRGSDYVVTFNYDTIVEESLEEVGRPFRLFPNRLESVGLMSSTIDSSRDDEEVVVLKLHGSLDWFDRTGYDESVAQFRRLAATNHPSSVADVYRQGPRHPVFGRERLVSAEPILEGPQPDDEALKQISRVRDPSALYREDRHRWATSGASPFILSPSYQKILYSEKLVSYWNGFGESGGGLGLSIVGFSLPHHDSYALQAIYSLTRNYTESWFDERSNGWLKLPVRLVDFRATDEARHAHRDTYRFLNWERAEAFYEGFDTAAVEFLFRETRGGYRPQTPGS